MIRGPNCENKDEASGCRSTLTRTIWDGDQILYEIRIPGDSNPAGALENDTPSAATHYGRVGYLHTGGIDHLALWKGTQLVLPHANWRGQFVSATCPSAPCTGVWLPGREVTAFIAKPLHPYGPPSWHGSLLENGEDASGYQYKRNRYYDPATGRFTQEDPIGLAGGLNPYLYAGDDPVNGRDPSGLSAGVPECVALYVDGVEIPCDDPFYEFWLDAADAWFLGNFGFGLWEAWRGTSDACTFSSGGSVSCSNGQFSAPAGIPASHYAFWAPPPDGERCTSFDHWAPPFDVWGTWKDIQEHWGSERFTITASPVGRTVVTGQVGYYGPSGWVEAQFARSITFTTGHALAQVRVRFRGNPYGTALRGKICK